jgi:hypothetical protein
MFLATFNVEAAFLEGKADCQMFARMSKDVDPDQTRLEIVVNWYGLKQGPRLWNDQLNSILLQLGFTRCPSHPCLYIRRREGVFIILGVHVDDGLMGCNNQAEFVLFQTELKAHVRNATVEIQVLKFTGVTSK